MNRKPCRLWQLAIQWVPAGHLTNRLECRITARRFRWMPTVFLHSLAYARYIDKTQVFYLVKNDHITHRVLHVQLVSKIGRTIGRFLGLNEDLLEAIALGHDIGHTPSKPLKQ